jgi:DNA-binding NtrC family response regulator
MHTRASVRSRARRPPPAAAPSGPLVPLALAGESVPARRARAALESPVASPLLILSDAGLDPPGIARYVHERTRPGQPFVHIDCARPVGDLVETSLFGTRTRVSSNTLETLGPGSAFVSARRGTVFLENVADLPDAAQRRLARLLRDGEARIGGRDRVRLAVRLVASGPPALQAEARDGHFRAELLRRFGPMPVAIPALRLRPEDLPTIVHRLASEVSAAAEKPAPSFTQAALTVLAAMPWPGNLDELRVTLGRVLRGVPGDVIRQEDLLHLLPIVPFQGVIHAHPAVSLREARRRFEREYIAAVLEQHDWRMSDAARTLGIERANLYRKTRQLGIARSAPADKVRT